MFRSIYNLIRALFYGRDYEANFKFEIHPIDLFFGCVTLILFILIIVM